MKDIYSVLKCDAKVVKRAQERLDGVDFEGQALGEEDEDELLDM